MGVYTQAVWGIGNGHPFSTTLLANNHLHLGEHLALLLLPIAPLYALVPDPRLLLLIQQLALAASGLPVYWFARQRLGHAPSLLVTAGYLLMPTLCEVALDAFYPIALTALLTGLAVAMAMTGRSRLAVLLAVLALLWEEEAAALEVGLGLFLLLRRADRLPGVTLCAASAGWLALATLVVMPGFHDPGTTDQEARTVGEFASLRREPGAWLATLARPPESCTSPPRLGWGRFACAAEWWLYPTGGLALLSPRTLLVEVPHVAVLLLGEKDRFRRHWAAPILPVLWLSTSAGLAALRTRRAFRPLLVWLAVAIGVMYARDSSLPLGHDYEPADGLWSERGYDLARLVEMVPRGQPVAASRRVLAHLANRQTIVVFPPNAAVGLGPPPERPRYYLVDLTNRDSRDALAGESDPRRSDPTLVELARTPNAVLLGGS
ncbi:MAG: DUF2079 domain-containing protein [Chloroflexi bacterium]|nr:DUF2079 domain-containing protein [Chloroflexota bacterium]